MATESLSPPTYSLITTIIEIFELIAAHIVADLLIALLGALLAFLSIFGRRSIRQMPLNVILRRMNLIQTGLSPLIAVPGFTSPSITIGRYVQGLPSSVRLVGLSDALALQSLQDTLHRTFPREQFDLRMHDRITNCTRPIFSVGGASVNETTASIIHKSLLQRGVWIEYPSHIARILDHDPFRIEGDSTELTYDYGFLIFSRNEWNPSVGCCLIFGLFPTGTWAATKLLEQPMRHKLLHKMFPNKRHLWLFLFLDYLRIRSFRELSGDWVIVVRSELTNDGFYPGEPNIILAEPIPAIDTSTQGWSRDVQRYFWDRMAYLPGIVGVAGDEPALSTKMVLDWLGRHSFHNDDILDFGCGPGRLFEGYFKSGAPRRLVAMDPNVRMLSRAMECFQTIREHINTNFFTKQGSIDDLTDFADGEFSVVVCWTVLNHILDDRECTETIKAISRVSNDRIIFCDPVCDEGQAPIVSHAFPTKRRPVSFYKNILNTCGFEVSTSIQRFGSEAHPEARRATIIAKRIHVRSDGIISD